MDSLENHLKDKLGEGKVQGNDDGSITVEVESGNKYILTEDGEVTLVSGTEVEPGPEQQPQPDSEPDLPMPKVEVGTIAGENSTIDGQLYSSTNPLIPKGFKAINTSTSTWGDTSTYKNGLVISDNKKNEFVWIPVNDIDDMVMCQKHGDAGNLSQETLQCTTCGASTKLAGKLYATGTGIYIQYFKSALTGQTYSASSGLREPANLSTSDDNTSNLSTWTSTLYQESFDEMVESVAKYKGFYVGRYETSLSDGVAQSIAGATSAKASSTSANKWFGFYEKSKAYSTSNSGLGVVSEMIWGCQYDQIMIWMENNGITVTSKTPTDTARGVEASYNSTRVTGASDSNDILNNVYDLIGNSYEWTQEAYNNDNNKCYRVIRGGLYNGNYSPSYRNGTVPSSTGDTNEILGSRLSLYIKL